MTDALGRLAALTRYAEIASRPPLTRNAVRCLKCADVIDSEHGHDFRRCSCGAVAVDGGLEYQRIVGEPSNYEVLAEFGPPEPTASKAYLHAAETLLAAMETATGVETSMAVEAITMLQEARERVAAAGAWQ